MALPTPATTSGPFPGASPETMDDLRMECSKLRQRVVGLEVENEDLANQLKEWRAWYATQYRPQIEYLDGEVSRLMSLAPFQNPTSPSSPMRTRTPSVSASPYASGSNWRPGPQSCAPPGMRRCSSDAAMGRKGRSRQTPTSLRSSAAFSAKGHDMTPLGRH
eukprot:TRINITY_DN92306_c0_g1_i1.p1 TRINITY_DN92306_c0_g1~~TRINITY_DN92306_c0_g1_i1.p1  ORF type:complete len:162 (+),score=20.92 TRINITY_DN92306_c0_g1_i1:117-602(+)